VYVISLDGPCPNLAIEAYSSAVRPMQIAMLVIRVADDQLARRLAHERKNLQIAYLYAVSRTGLRVPRGFKSLPSALPEIVWLSLPARPRS